VWLIKPQNINICFGGCGSNVSVFIYLKKILEPNVFRRVRRISEKTVSFVVCVSICPSVLNSSAPGSSWSFMYEYFSKVYLKYSGFFEIWQELLALYINTIVQGVPLATESGISLIILTPVKILQRNLNRSTFVVWEMKRNVFVVCVRFVAVS
jgi:hypothetical protein